MGVRAYDNTRRNVVGTVLLEVSVEEFSNKVEFHVLDILASFNLLLGRPWLHHPNIMSVPSSLHQKVQLGLAEGSFTIYGDSGIYPHAADNAPILEIIHGEEDVTLGGFSFDTVDDVHTIKIDEDFMISSVAVKMMKKMSYMPGMGLGRDNQGVPEFPKFRANNGRFGLGYVPTGKEEMGMKRGPIRFVKAEEERYLGQPEPFWDSETNKQLPGFEIFTSNTWESDDEAEKLTELVKALNVDWVEYMGSNYLSSLFEESPTSTIQDGAAVMMVEEEALEDFTSFIVDAVGTYKIAFLYHV